jgi:hypothetical protein
MLAVLRGLALLVFVAHASHAAADFTLTGSMSTDRYYGTATLLADGMVLITGGLTRNGVISSAELYDPATGSFTPTGGMTTPRYFHRATLLADGRVFITGGQTFTPVAQIHSSAEVYDPGTGTFTPIGDMGTPRMLHTATLLADGKVLIAGGYDGGRSLLRDAELYDPTTNTFAPTGSMVLGRSDYTATLLPNGNVLVAGGGSASAELYDPATGVFAVTGSMARHREEHTATLLADGRVLVVGGFWDDGSTELYDPASGLFAPAGSMSVPRFSHAAAALPDGGVLISGGAVPPPPGVDSTPLASAEVFDPTTNSFGIAGDMTVPRQYHTATTLADGRVLIAGGDGVGTAELYAAAAPSFAIDVTQARVKFGRPGKVDDKVSLQAKFTYPGAPEGVIKVVFDGVTLLDVPFASFEREHRNTYAYRARNVHAKIDLQRGTLKLTRHRMLLTGIDNANGIDVVIRFGASVATDHFVMREHRHHGERTLYYGTKTDSHDRDEDARPDQGKDKNNSRDARSGSRRK